MGYVRHTNAFILSLKTRLQSVSGHKTSETLPSTNGVLVESHISRRTAAPEIKISVIFTTGFPIRRVGVVPRRDNILTWQFGHRHTDKGLFKQEYSVEPWVARSYDTGSGRRWDSELVLTYPHPDKTSWGNLQAVVRLFRAYCTDVSLSLILFVFFVR